MGFFSFNCAVKKTSIPAPYELSDNLLKHSDVTLLLPYDNKIIGQYDGYGGIKQENGEIVDIIAICDYFATSQHTPTIEEFNTINKNSDIYKSHRNSGIDKYFDGKLQVKLVKNNSMNESVNYDNTEASTDCKFQGYFYDDEHMQFNITGEK